MNQTTCGQAGQKLQLLPGSAFQASLPGERSPDPPWGAFFHHSPLPSQGVFFMNGLFDPRREHDACGVGFVAHLDGVCRHQVITMSLEAMARMAHRGGGNGKSGDGAGLLFPLPRHFFQRQWPLLNDISSPFAVAQLFLPRSDALKEMCLQRMSEIFASCGLRVADGRDVPVSVDTLDAHALSTMPAMVQLLILPDEGSPLAVQGGDDEALERCLFLARRLTEKALACDLEKAGADPRSFYAASCSSRSIVYKGMLPGSRLGEFYADLCDPDCAAPFAVFHERFSTNTMPAWPLAQPFRMAAHNGEINTLRGNAAHMTIREAALSSSLLGPKLREILPVISPYTSDSGSLDNVLELLARSGWELTHALMMMIPEPFGSTFVMGDNKRAFYEYHSSLMEPWDGPTCLVFTDGCRRVGAMLDRNGLRPCRWSVSRDGLVVLGSESGIVDVPEEEIVQRGQLRPRRMILADIQRHHLAPDAEIKGQVVRSRPWRRWLQKYAVRLENLNSASDDQLRPLPPLERRLRQAGCDDAWLKSVLIPMAENAQEPVCSMGSNLPLPCLSDEPQSLFCWFRQRFAQITNPPIDPYREQLSMSLMGHVGREGNLLEPGPESCAMLRLPHPFLTAEAMRHIRSSRKGGIHAVTLDATFTARGDGKALVDALDALCTAAEDAVQNGTTLLIVSDAAMTKDRAPIPALLACAGVHHHLIRAGLRHCCGIIAESGEACEVMHMAQLIGYGVNAVFPHAALEEVRTLARAGRLRKDDAVLNEEDAEENYINALKKGLLKAFARLGISTLRSFLGSQPFEVTGLSRDVVERCFTGTPCSIDGAGFDILARDAALRHERAWSDEGAASSMPRVWNRDTVRALHEAVHARSPLDAEAWKKFTEFCDEREDRTFTLRSLLSITSDRAPLPLEEVEDASHILRHFVGAAISFGAISAEAHRAIAEGCNRCGAVSNCGEGGEDPSRNTPFTDAEGVHDTRSRIRQVASGRFGVTAEYLIHAEEIQIKAAQGAKPGEGGQLPAYKVTTEIARVRGTMPGVSLVSPPPHHDIYSIEDLAQLIYDLRRLNPTARISVKLVAESGVGTIAVGVAKAGADCVVISGHDGGTGASPHSAIHYVGLPWESGLAETQQALVESGLRDRISIQTDGLLRTGRDVIVAAMLGAEQFAFGTALMVSLGCIMCRNCMKGRCPAGIATQDVELRRRFKGTPEDVEHYLRLLAEDVRRHLAALGFRSLDDIIGRCDLLSRREDLTGRAAELDLSRLLHCPDADAFRHRTAGYAAAASTPLEEAMAAAAAPVLNGQSRTALFRSDIRNTDRSVGARLSGDIVMRFGAGGLPEGSINLRFRGQAGQSLGAFLAPGVRLEVEGGVNDYAGKGLSGGTIIVRPSTGARFTASEQAVAGNVALYGATSGEAYFCGQAGERFAVRNSGACAVVEGVGDHGCEYMTGGTVVVLGRTGYNFAAGMSGGTAFVYDADEHFQNRCNIESVDLESVWQEEDRTLLRSLVERHFASTGSAKAAALLDNWDAALPLFVKVMPLDYRNVLRRQAEEAHDAETTSATEEVFHSRGEEHHA